MSNTIIICIEPLWPGADCMPYYVSLPEGLYPESHPPAELWSDLVEKVAMDMAFHPEDLADPEEMAKVTVEHFGCTATWYYDGRDELVGAHVLEVTPLSEYK